MDFPSKFSTWIYRFAHNLSLNQLAKMARNPEKVKERELQQQENPQSYSGSWEQLTWDDRKKFIGLAMNLKENELKQYFKESKGLEKDLSPFIMDKIAQESKTTFQPVDLPKPLFWGIAILFMGIFSLCIPQLERGNLICGNPLIYLM